MSPSGELLTYDESDLLYKMFTNAMLHIAERIGIGYNQKTIYMPQPNDYAPVLGDLWDIRNDVTSSNGEGLFPDIILSNGMTGIEYRNSK